MRRTIKSALTAVAPSSSFLVRLPVKDGHGCEVALTFDDGPHPENTPRVLDRLAARGMSATFFVVGERARRHPAIVKRIVDEGHVLGNHSYTHPEPWHTSPAELVAEARRTRALLEDITGRECRLFRPPLGVVDARKLLSLWMEGQCVVLWSVDTLDYAMTSTDEMTQWCSAYRPTPGDIVLMHDDRPRAHLAVDALPERLGAGVSFVTIPAAAPAISRTTEAHA